MNLTEAEILARTLMMEHAPGWSFAWSRARTQFGLCMFGPKTIKLSRHLVEINEPATVEDVIRHELAHVKTGWKAPNHGRVWKAHALTLGANPKRCTVNAVGIDGNIVATCPGCGATYRAHRLTYAAAFTQACAPCHKQGRGYVRFSFTRADTGEAIDTSTLKRPAPRRRKRRYAR
jgi:predicted SprT family Zn-dependent metalloprotease